MKTNQVYVCDSNMQNIGAVVLTEEEINHFTNTGSVPASLALDSNQIASLGIEDETEIYIREK